MSIGLYRDTNRNLDFNFLKSRSHALNFFRIVSFPNQKATNSILRIFGQTVNRYWLVDNTQNELFPKLRFRSFIIIMQISTYNTVLVNILQSIYSSISICTILHENLKMKYLLVFLKRYLMFSLTPNDCFIWTYFYWLLRNTSHIEFTPEQMEIETIKYSNTTCFAFFCGGVVYVTFCNLNTEFFSSV